MITWWLGCPSLNATLYRKYSTQDRGFFSGCIEQSLNPSTQLTRSYTALTLQSHLSPLLQLEFTSSKISSWLPRWLSGRRICLQCRRCGFDPWVRKIPLRRAWQPTPVFLPGESHGERSLVGYTLWGHKVRHNWDNWACTQMQLISAPLTGQAFSPWIWNHLLPASSYSSLGATSKLPNPVLGLPLSIIAPCTSPTWFSQITSYLWVVFSTWSSVP